MDYQLLNLNPLGIKEEDCVCRAISLATEKDYEDIKYKLYLIAELYECETLCVCCYKHLLDNVFKLTRIHGCRGMSIKEFGNLYPKGTYIIRVEGHLTCAIDCTIYDIWDCRDEIIDIVWKIDT